MIITDKVKNKIGVCCAKSVGLWKRAEELARILNLPLVDIDDREYPYLLTFTEKRLELRNIGPQSPGPFYVDFTSGTLRYRLQKGGGTGQLLAKAVGIKGSHRPTILDATAGMGRDGFILAWLGCNVTMIERSPILAALLEDGLQRGLDDKEIGGIVRDRITLVVGNSVDIMGKLAKEARPETVYLDPMYPMRIKSALVKKEMRYIKAIAGDDDDAPKLLEIALATALKRVTVKRPRLAPAIAGPEPTTAIKSKNSRYDIYLVKQGQ